MSDNQVSTGVALFYFSFENIKKFHFNSMRMKFLTQNEKFKALRTHPNQKRYQNAFIILALNISKWVILGNEVLGQFITKCDEICHFWLIAVLTVTGVRYLYIDASGTRLGYFWRVLVIKLPTKLAQTWKHFRTFWTGSVWLKGKIDVTTYGATNGLKDGNGNH